MKVVWSPDNASKAYIDTVKSVSSSFLTFSFFFKLKFFSNEGAIQFCNSNKFYQEKILKLNQKRLDSCVLWYITILYLIFPPDCSIFYKTIRRILNIFKKHVDQVYSSFLFPKNVKSIYETLFFFSNPLLNNSFSCEYSTII